MITTSLQSQIEKKIVIKVFDIRINEQYLISNNDA